MRGDGFLFILRPPLQPFHSLNQVSRSTMRPPTRRTFLAAIASAFAAASSWLAGAARAQTKPRDEPPGPPASRRRRPADGDYPLPAELAAFGLLSIIAGRPANRSITLSALSKENAEAYIEYGTAPGKYENKSDLLPLHANEPAEFTLAELQPDTAYFYRLQLRKSPAIDFTPNPESRFHTQRAPASTFTFTLQGDSHPERPQMSHPDLYARTLLGAAAAAPDFHICIGDDFSIEKLRAWTADTIAARYLLQRPFLALVGAPLFLLNGNHEQASLFNYNQKGRPHDAAVWAQTARNRLFPMPAPDAFYTGNSQQLKPIGFLRDYYAFTWGDALFIILDNYWHSPVQVDTRLPAEGEVLTQENDKPKSRDWWEITIGDQQYQWLKKTLADSQAAFKFVFAHHVMGTGRGGIEQSELYEWGGKNKRGDSEFKTKRPHWDLPIHDLMVKHGVNIFFQGHDHLFARQQRDGIVYQELPMPADHGYVAYNQERYPAGTKLPNSGYLQVTVSPQQVKVDYVRVYLPRDENDKQKTGDIAHTYTLQPKP